MSKSATQAVWPRIIGLSFVYDLGAVTGPGVAVWLLWFAAADSGVFAALTVLRLAVVFLQLRHHFAALHRWQASQNRRGPDLHAELSDAQLLVIDEQLQQAPRRFAIRYTFGLVAMLGCATALGQLGIPVEVPVGRGELLMLGLLFIGLSLGITPMLVSLLDPILLEPRSQVGAEIAARGLDSKRRPCTLVGWSARLNIPYTLSVYFCTVGIVGKVSVEGWRTAGLAEQRVRVGEVALSLAEGREPAELGESLQVYGGGGELVPEWIESFAVGEAEFATLDVKRNRLVAGAMTGAGQWIVADSEFDDRSGLLWLLAFSFPTIFMVPLVVSNLSVTRSHVRQLTEVREATQRVLGGGGLGDIARFRPPRNDELGLLIGDFNGLLDVLQELAGAAHAVADGDLTVELERPGDFHDAFRGMLARLQEVVGQIRDTALELQSAAAGMRDGVSDQEQVVELQSRSILEVSDTVEQLAVAAKSITLAAAGVLGNAERTETNADAMVSEITKLTEGASNIAELLDLVREIADRSDLLALNGSLEATRAGEAGRGFALVASEMRRLAERVGGTVSDVREKVREISTSGASTVNATEQTRELSRLTASAAREISSVTQTQGSDTQRVSDAIHEVSASVAQTAAATALTRMAAEGLEQRADALERLTHEFKIDEHDSDVHGPATHG